jgi:malate permease and related proteins
VIPIAATIALSAAIGIGAERRFEERARRAARGIWTAILYTLVPFIAFFNIARLHVNVDVAGGLVFAYVTLAAVGLMAYVLGSRLLCLERPATGSLIAAAMQVNTGYVGLPLVVTFLGSDHLGQAAAYDALVTAPWLFGPVFAVGAAFGHSAGETAGERIRSFFVRNPPLLAVIAAVLVPDSLAPDALVHASRVAVFALIPLGFFAVGVTLATEAEEEETAFPPPLTRPVATVVALRLLVAPVLLYLLALPFINLPDSYLLLAAMPCGINSIVVAHTYGLDMRIAAGAVAWSTSVVVVVALVVSPFV